MGMAIEMELGILGQSTGESDKSSNLFFNSKVGGFDLVQEVHQI